MSHWKKSFPSRWFQVSDLDDGPLDVTIKSVGAENVGGEDDLKLVVKFHEADTKGLVCNVTRAEAIGDLAGSADTDAWAGTKIRLARGTTNYKGRRVDCIEVVAPPRGEARKPAAGAGDDIKAWMPTRTEGV